MVHISTFVFFDIETTGLPYQERNQTKIIELSLVAVNRRDLRRFKSEVWPNSKLTLLLNPNRPIDPQSASISGITNEIVKYAPTFEDKINTIKSFLEDLRQPVCLVAHNGNVFDYKILQAECNDAEFLLPDDILCVDSLPGFRKLLKNKPIIQTSILTDDEDDWPELNMTRDDFIEIDEIIYSSESSNDSYEVQKLNKKYKVETVTTSKKNVKPNKSKRDSFKLVDIYKRLLHKDPVTSHRAEGDCLTLLQCVAMCQQPKNPDEDFLYWIDNNCKSINEIIPLMRK